MTARASIESLLRDRLAARAPHLRLVTLDVDAAAPVRATWWAELEVGPHAPAFAAQLELRGHFDDLNDARL